MAEKIDKQELREFSLSSFAVDNGTSIFLIALMILLFGIQSYNVMPKEQYPDASMPTIYINTPYFGNSAEEIENLITKPIEKEIESISELKTVNSSSVQDFSVIIAEFNSDIEISEAVRKTKDAIDKAKSELPNDLDQEPTVLEINFADLPIVTINVSGNYAMDQLREYAEYIQDRVENVKQINKVVLKGAQDREVQVDVDLFKMQSLQVSFGDIDNALKSENVTMSAGEIERDGFSRSVRIVGQFADVSELENVIVKSENQRPIYLKDIANVVYGFEDRKSYARSDGLPVIALDVIKRKGENLLFAADEIKIVLDDVRSILPSDLKVSLFNDLSVNTRNEVSNLENSIISGVLLVILVLLFFLGLRNATFVGMAIPLSMLMGILFLHMMGTIMNIVVLFSLILALGLLVDNAIVVVENIYRYMQNGYDQKSAAKFGAGEVAMPIIASTATTLAAFIPLAFWPGLMGEFMKYMPITLIIVLSSSLFVALVINPVLTSRFMKVDKKAEDRSGYVTKRTNMFYGVLVMLGIGLLGQLVAVDWLRNLMGFAIVITVVNFFALRPLSFAFQNSFLPFLERNYDRFITGALRRYNPLLVFGGAFLTLFLTLILLGIKPPPVELFPSGQPLYVNAFIELPIGKSIEETNIVVRNIEKEINETVGDRATIVEAVLTQIGEETSDPNSPPEPGFTPNKARITVQFVKTQDRGGVLTSDIMNDMRTALQGYAGVEVSVDKNADGPPVGKPINIEVRGEEVDSLIALTQNMKLFLEERNIGGVEELKSDVKIGKPELTININREAARRYELSTYSIASTIRSSLFGLESSKFKVGEDEYPIMIRLNEEQRNDINTLVNQKVTFRNPANGRIVQVPISAVADFSYSSTYNSIKRKDSERVITVFSNILDGYNANEVIAEIQGALDEYDFPEGYTYEFTGEQQQQAEDMAFLMNAFLIALFAIFIIIVAQFNSIISPFIIVLSILFSTIGVFLGYFLSGDTVSIVFSGVGIISLAGVVVNNAIVLIDYINLLIRRKARELGVDGMSGLSNDQIRRCIIEGGSTRLRPVLLTAITTILGLIPLAIGFNMNFFTLISEFDPQIFIGGDNTAMWGPMAWTIIYGLTFATFLTLVVVPVMYWLAFRLTRAFNKPKTATKSVEA